MEETPLRSGRILSRGERECVSRERELKRRKVIKAGFKVIYSARINTSFVHELKNSFRMPRDADACATHPVQIYLAN